MLIFDASWGRAAYLALVAIVLLPGVLLSVVNLAAWWASYRYGIVSFTIDTPEQAPPYTSHSSSPDLRWWPASLVLIASFGLFVGLIAAMPTIEKEEVQLVTVAQTREVIGRFIKIGSGTDAASIAWNSFDPEENPADDDPPSLYAPTLVLRRESLDLVEATVIFFDIRNPLAANYAVNFERWNMANELSPFRDELHDSTRYVSWNLPVDETAITGYVDGFITEVLRTARNEPLKLTAPFKLSEE